MLYQLLYSLHTQFSFFNVFRYITLRTIYATLTALVITFFLGPVVIRLLTRHQIGQYIREEGPQSHLTKKGTPTMGGILILFAVTVGHPVLGGPDQPVYLAGPFGHAGFRSYRFHR